MLCSVFLWLDNTTRLGLTVLGLLALKLSYVLDVEVERTREYRRVVREKIRVGMVSAMRAKESQKLKRFEGQDASGHITRSRIGPEYNSPTPNAHH